MDKWGQLILAIVICVICFFMGRSSHGTIEIPELPDVSKYTRAIDSLKSVNVKYQDSVKFAYDQIDSLKKKKVINKKKTQDGVNEIKKFTPDSRLRWRDSVRRANGL